MIGKNHSKNNHWNFHDYCINSKIKKITQSEEKKEAKNKTNEQREKMSNINKKAIQIIKLPWKIIIKKQNICIKNNNKIN